jgi:lipopolysaccharide export system protein LptA
MQSRGSLLPLLMAALAAAVAAGAGGAAVTAAHTAREARTAQQQRTTTCNYVARSAYNENQLVFISGPMELDCADGVIVRADSAVNIRNMGEWYLIGHVFYADSVKKLNADWVHYLSAQRMLQGRGSVVVTDVASGSTISGDQLQYFRAVADSVGRENGRMIVTGGRPHAVLYGGYGSTAPAPGAPDTTRPPPLDTTGFVTPADTMKPRPDTTKAGAPNDTIKAKPRRDTTTVVAPPDTTKPRPDTTKAAAKAAPPKDTAKAAPAPAPAPGLAQLPDTTRSAPPKDTTKLRPDTTTVVAPQDTARPHPDTTKATPALAPAPAPRDTTPTLVDGNLIELDGESAFRATGNVQIQRTDMRGYGNEASYDGTSRLMVLTGNARVVGDSAKFTLTGASITTQMDARNRIQSVLSQGQAELKSKQADITGPVLRIAFEGGEVRQLIGLGTRRVAAKPAPKDTVQAVAKAQAVTLVGDSVDFYGRGQQADSVYAVGTAYGEQTPDSVRADLPELLRSDWARGDTIRAYFTLLPDSVVQRRRNARLARDTVRSDTLASKAAAVGDTLVARAAAAADTATGRRIARDATRPPPARDSTAGPAVAVRPPARDTIVPALVRDTTPPDTSVASRTVLDRLVVVGDQSAPAQAVYRARRSGAPLSEKPSINYMIATAITIHMKEGQVSGVDATGPVKGVHLDPAPTDTTDTTAVGQKKAAAGQEAAGRQTAGKAAAGKVAKKPASAKPVPAKHDSTSAADTTHVMPGRRRLDTDGAARPAAWARPEPMPW